LQLLQITKLVVCSLLIATAVPTVYADEMAGDSNRVEAKRLRDTGAEAIDRGDFAAALDSFSRALELFPSPNLRYNLGVALDGLGRWSEAAEEFEEFLAAAPNAPAAARDFAAAKLRERDPFIGRLAIDVSPPGADVAVDGKRFVAPRARPLPVMPGVFVVTARMAGYEPLTRQVKVVAGERVRVELSLRPSPTVGVAAPASASPPWRDEADARERRAGRRLRTTGLGLGGGGLALVAAGAVFAGLTASIDDRVNHPAPGSAFDDTLVARGRSFQAAEQALLVIGVSGITAGTVLFVVGQHRLRRSAASPPRASSTRFTELAW
jgi:tetratricopeptide repeat protein/PEGA domain-containing protein